MSWKAVRLGGIRLFGCTNRSWTQMANGIYEQLNVVTEAFDLDILRVFSDVMQ